MHPLHQRLVLLSSLAWVSWACSDGTAPADVHGIAVAPGSAVIGTTGSHQFRAEVWRRDGTPVTGGPLQWSSSDPTVARIDATGLATAEGMGSTIIRASLGGVEGTAELTVALLPTSARLLQGDGQSGVVARELPDAIVVEMRDADDEPVRGARVTFSSSHDGIADPGESLTDDSGRTRTRWTLGATAGPQTLTARSGDLVVRFGAIAVAAAASRMAISGGDGQTGPPGSVLPDSLEVRVTDPFGNPVPGTAVRFDATEGVVAPDSSVTDAGGRARTALTLPGREGTGTVSVSGGGLPVVTFRFTADHGPLGISAAGLGRGRVSLPYDGSLLARGGSGSGYAFTLTAGSLPPGLTLSRTGNLEGVPIRDGHFPFTVEVVDDEAGRTEASLSVAVCPGPAELEVGDTWTGDLPVPGDCGLFLDGRAPGARYRVAVVRPTRIESAEVVSPVTLALTGEGPGPPASTVAGAGAELRRAPTSPGDLQALREAVRTLEETARHHAAQRARDLETLRRTGPGALLPDRSPRGGAALRMLEPMPGKLRLDVGSAADCSAGPVRVALKLAEDDRLAVYQDSVQNASEHTNVSPVKARALLDFYREHGEPVIEGYFGGVSDVDGNGRVVVYISPLARGAIAGYVWSGDLLSSSACPASNGMELIYFNGALVDAIGQRPTVAFETLVHEMKHVSSLYRSIRRSQGGVSFDFQPLWVEEGVAELAGEMASRLAWHAAGGPAPHARVTAEDVKAPGLLQEDHGLALRARLFLTQGYLSSQPNGVIVSPRGAGPYSSVYGSGWLFHRWLGDAYADAGSAPLADAGLFRTLNEASHPRGIQGIEEAVGRSWEQLLEEYAAALMADGQPVPPPARGFSLYDFASTIETYCFAIDAVDFPGSPCDHGINSAPVGPPGAFPWPVTVGAGGGSEAAPLADGSWSGSIGSSGVRVHEFVADGTVAGAAIHVHGPSPSRLVVVRLK